MAVVYTKSAKGLREASGKTRDLSRDLRELLKACNGLFSIESKCAEAAPDDREWIASALADLVDKGYLRDVPEASLENDQPIGDGGSLDSLDFSSPAQIKARQGEEKAAREAEARARRKAEEQAQREAREKTQREAEERARHAANEKARREAEEKIRHEAEAKIRREAEEQARREAEEKARREAEAQAKRKAEELARREAEELARLQEEERVREAKRKTAEGVDEAAAKLRAEFANRRGQRDGSTSELLKQLDEAARLKAQEKAAREAAETARREAEQQARREAAEKARRDAEERARREAEEQARIEAEERARREEEERIRREAEEKARREAEEIARREAEEQARIEAAERARREEEERIRREAEEKARREAEEIARREAEEQARIEAAERARREEEERIRREAEEKARREAEEIARREAEEQARIEAEERARREEEERIRREAEEKARREAEEIARREAEERARIEAEERARRAAEEKARREEEERLRRIAEKKAREEAEERARLEQEERDREAIRERIRQRNAKRRRVILPTVFGLILPLLLGLTLLNFYSFEGKRIEFEKTATELFGVPVKAGSAKFWILTGPQWRLDDVTLGADADAVRIARVGLGTSWLGIFGAPVRFDSIHLDGPQVPPSIAFKLLTQTSAKELLQSGELTANGLVFAADAKGMPPLNLRASYRDGRLMKISAQGEDAEAAKLSLDMQREDQWRLTLAATHLRWLLGPGLPLSEVALKADLLPASLVVTEFSAKLLDGELAGNGNLSWQGGWRAAAKLDGRLFDATRLAPAWIPEGRVNGSAAIVAEAASPQELVARARTSGSFNIGRGLLAGIDLDKAVQNRGLGEQFRFESLKGDFFSDSQRIEFSGLNLVARDLKAQAALSVDASRAVNGRVNIEVQTTGERRTTSLRVGGSLAAPQYQR
ncbi:MAG: hypothetical protein Q8S20_08205 [Sulfuritalea sp.]|nr:hypothetical protein [Sulfuritalea sp.]